MSRARLSVLAAFLGAAFALVVLVLSVPTGTAPDGASGSTAHAADAPEPRIWLPTVLNELKTGGLGPNDPKEWAVAARWPYGPAEEAIPVGDRTYFAYGAQVEVLSTDSPTVTVEASIALTSAIKDMVYQSPYLLLANSDAGIVMLDTQSSVTPTVAGSLATATKAVKIEAREQRAYVLYERTGLKVYDISNSSNISETGSLVLSGTFTAIARKDTALYIGTREGTLYVVDISDDRVPKQVASPDTGGSGAITDLLAIDDRLYLVQGTKFMIFEIGSILAPQKRGEYTAPDNRTLRGVAVDTVNNRAYVVQEISPSGFRTIDISSVDSPSEVGSIVTTAGPALSAVYDANRLHFVSQSRYQIIDLSAPQDQPANRGRDAFGTVYDVEVAGDNVYISGDAGGVAILNVGNAETPQLVARWRPDGWSRSLFITGTVLYSVQVVDGDGLRLVAASLVTPTQPTTIGISDKVALPVGQLERPFELTVSNGYAYVAGAGAGLLAFDVQNDTPVLVSSPSTNPDANVDARSVDVNGRSLYVGAVFGGSAQLRTYDLSINPSGPAIMGQIGFSFTGDPGEMLIEDGSLFANIASALNIFGVLDPTRPSLSGAAGSPAPGGNHYGITRIGKYVYVTDPVNAVVHVYDASRTFLPTLYTDLSVTSEPGALNDNEELLFIGDQSAGLVILQ